MPSLKDLKDSMESGSDLPQDDLDNLKAALMKLKDTLNTHQAIDTDLAKSLIVADGQRLLAEAEVRRASLESRDLARQHSESLQQLRQESNAAARKYYWLGSIGSSHQRHVYRR